MTPRTAIAQLAKIIGRELEVDPRPSESAMETGLMLATAGATPDVLAGLLVEARRKRPNDRMMNAYAFMLGEALATLRMAIRGRHAKGNDDTPPIAYSCSC